MVYDVWDSETANIVGAFESQPEALDALGHALDEHGPGYVSVLVLGLEDDAGDTTLIATGDELVRLVQENRAGASQQSGPNGVPAIEAVATGTKSSRS